MTKVLTADEMIDVLQQLGHHRAREMQDRATAFARELAELVAEATGLIARPGNWEGAELGGAAAGFWKPAPDHSVPDIVNFFDSSEPVELWES